MAYEMMNKPNKIELYNVENPIYGPMGRKVTPIGWDSWEMQHRQAIKRIKWDLTPVKEMDDLR